MKLGRLWWVLPLVVILAACSAPRPAVFKPLPKLHLAPRRQTAPAPMALPTPDTFIPWQYAPGAGGYCWTLQTSTDLVHWADQPSGCLTGSLRAAATNGMMFFRLRGQPF